MKQAYQRPEIEDLGTLADITLGSGAELTDIQGLGLDTGGIGGSLTDPSLPSLPELPSLP